MRWWYCYKRYKQSKLYNILNTMNIPEEQVNMLKPLTQESDGVYSSDIYEGLKSLQRI